MAFVNFSSHLRWLAASQRTSGRGPAAPQRHQGSRHPAGARRAAPDPYVTGLGASKQNEETDPGCKRLARHSHTTPAPGGRRPGRPRRRRRRLPTPARPSPVGAEPGPSSRRRGETRGGSRTPGRPARPCLLAAGSSRPAAGRRAVGGGGGPGAAVWRRVAP